MWLLKAELEISAYLESKNECDCPRSCWMQGFRRAGEMLEGGFSRSC